VRLLLGVRHFLSLGLRANISTRSVMMPTLTDDASVSQVDAQSVGEALFRVASEARYFRSPDGRFHAQVPVEDRHEVLGLKSAAFRDWLIESYRRDSGQLPPDSSVRRVVAALEARARFDRRTPTLYVRVGGQSAGAGLACYLDLGDSTGQAVKITAREWAVVEEPPVHFDRPAGLLALPVPTRGGSIELLRRYVNVTEPDFRMLIGWMAAALLPDGPYPILAIHGEQGSAKSTLAKVVRLLIDPQASPVLAEPRSTRDLMVTAANGWLMVYDNISAIRPWLSDSLCRLATGGGFAGRALYSNGERNVIHAERPIILNGIDEFVRRADLADRCVFLHLPPILATGRRAEGEFWGAFRTEQPAILGALLDAAVGGLAKLQSVQLTELPRMADFACFGEAVGRGLGWPEGSFVAAYRDNRQDATLTSLEDSVVAAALLSNAAWGGLENWTLCASEMLSALARQVDPRVRASVRWPKTPRAFADELRRIAPQLRTVGISVTFTKAHEGRLITLHAEPSFFHTTGSHDSD
jgi:hypothetical protein